MKKTDLAYYAGIFDGEGTIGVYYQARKNSHLRVTYQLRVQLVSTDEWIIQSLRFAFGGNVIIEPRKENPKWATAYRWFLTRQQSLNFINAVIPYLRLKRPQAELALKYQVHKTNGGYKTKEYMDFETDYKKLFTELNKTGKK